MPSIYWEDHSADVMRLVGDMYQNKTFTDCSLDTEGGIIHGHKTILAACSPYMQKLFKDHHGKKTIMLKEVNYKDMKLILDFIYYGEICVPVTHMVSLRKSAELLQISSLESVSQNFLNTFSAKEADDRSGGNSGTSFGEDFIKHAEREMHLHENRWSGSQDLHQKSDFQSIASCMNIDQQLENDHETNPCSNTKLLSKSIIEDQSEISFTNTRVIMEKPVINDSEIVQDQLRNPLDMSASESDALKFQNVTEQTCPTKMEIKQDMDISELDFKITENDSVINEAKSAFYSDVVPLGNEIEHSCDDMATNVEGTMFMATEPMSDVQSIQSETLDRSIGRVCSGKCIFERTEALEVIFESTFELDLKEEKPFVTELDVEDTLEENEPFSLKQRNEESFYIDSLQDVNSELGVTTTSKLEPENAIAALKRNQLPYQVEANVDKSAINREYGSSKVQKISSALQTDVRKCPGKEESLNSSHCNGVFSSTDDSSHASDKVPDGSGNIYVKHIGDLISERNFSCIVCGRIFRYHWNLNVHMRTHTGEKPFKCKECVASFSDKGNLKYHMRIHTGEKPFRCWVCDASFRQLSHLTRHKRTHTGEKPFKCSECDTSFSASCHLTRHKRTHTGEKPFKCCECDASYSDPSTLKRHMQTHTGEKPFKCRECDASFSKKDRLNKHMRIHTGEKPFTCGECHASFRLSEHLRRHFRIHTGEKPFKCGECEATFSQSNSLRMHKRIHTGETAFKCGECDASFRHKRSLTIHLPTHSGEKLF